MIRLEKNIRSQSTPVNVNIHFQRENSFPVVRFIMIMSEDFS